jgi:hypothetical protein
MSTFTIPVIMKKIYSIKPVSRYWYILAAFAIGTYPLSSIAGESGKCADMDARWNSESDSIYKNKKMTPPTSSLWLIPVRGSGKVDLKNSLGNLINKEFYKRHPRYSCTYNYGSHGWGSTYYNYGKGPDFPGKMCIDNTTKFQFDGTNSDLIDKNGVKVEIQVADREKYTYVYCKPNQILTFSLLELLWTPSGSETSKDFPYLLFQMERFKGAIDKVYTVQSMPQF